MLFVILSIVLGAFLHKKGKKKWVDQTSCSFFVSLFKNKLCKFFCQAVREQLVQLMFETFNISGFYASEQAVLSLYAVGRISGCTVDIGHGKIGIFTWQTGFFS